VISSRHFNNSKDLSILLIHGLFANIEFWHNHLSIFKNFKIFLCDIDYNNFFDNPNADFGSISEHLNGEKIAFSISHSFGSIINSLLNKQIKNKYLSNSFIRSYFNVRLI